MVGRPYQAEVYDSRRIPRAFEGDLVAEWHQRFVDTAGDPNGDSTGAESQFRTTADTGGPPIAAEHQLMPPILILDAVEMAMRPPVGSWPVAGSTSGASVGIDAAARLVSNPMPTVLTEGDDGVDSFPEPAVLSGWMRYLAAPWKYLTAPWS